MARGEGESSTKRAKVDEADEEEEEDPLVRRKEELVVALKEARSREDARAERVARRELVTLCGKLEAKNEKLLGRLPPELWEKIVDENLHQNDLLALAMTCRFFREKQKDLGKKVETNLHVYRLLDLQKSGKMTSHTLGWFQWVCDTLDIQAGHEFKDWLKDWLKRVCHYASAEAEQLVKEWDRLVQAKCPVSKRLQFVTDHTHPDGPRQVPAMVVEAAKLDVTYSDDEGRFVCVDVSYTNACTPDADKTLRNARTAGKAASVRADEKRKRYPPDRHPHAELVPFVVEARGRLGEEVLPFLKQHAPAEEPLRSAVLARALRDIAVITQHGLAALLLAAEPRPNAV